MKLLTVNGGNSLDGEIKISGAKNASLPILMATALIEDGEASVSNIPNISDIEVSLELLNHIGIKTERYNDKIITNAKNIITTTAPHEIVSKIMASFWILGALVGRFGEAKVSAPGGDAIGKRQRDIYIAALKQMGVDIEERDDYVFAKALKNNKPQGADITFRLPSVGATHNTMMAGVLAEGTTIIRNAAKEPEVVSLANFLKGAGAKIEGAGTDTIKIEGIKKLHSVEYKVIGDRMEAFSYMLASTITKGNLILSNADFFGMLEKPIEILKQIGAGVEKIDDFTVKVTCNNKPKAINIETDFFPGFPTDCQAPITALLGLANGISVIDENVFENRFLHVKELNKMKANIVLESNKRAVINGVEKYYGTNVTATDIRAGMCLVLAGLSAEGITKISDIYHIERGYEDLVNKLNNCGAKLKIVEE
jgi:UDP-N-acetylglucosamine 1-carboxyvinyltransferase